MPIGFRRAMHGCRSQAEVPGDIAGEDVRRQRVKTTVAVVRVGFLLISCMQTQC
jgi:hypothetical protein